MSNTKIIYHKINKTTSCPDGLTASWSALKKYPDAEVIGWEYQTEPPLAAFYITEQYITGPIKLLFRNLFEKKKHPQKTLIAPGDRVVIVDFSFPKEVLDSWVAIGAEVIVIDHHKTAQKMLEGFAGGILRFDMEKCGAMLTWEYFFPGEPVPEFIKYVQDQDLWQWALPYSKEVREAFGSLGRNFKTFDFLETLLGDEFVEYMRAVGEPLVMAREDRVEAIAGRHKDTQLDEYVIKAVELTEDELYLTSDVCAYLYNRYPKVSFVACFSYGSQNWLQKLLKQPRPMYWSLRSSNKNPNAVDVSAIAKRRGGGGHHNAAGYTSVQNNIQMSKCKGIMNYAEAIGDWVKFREKQQNETAADYLVEKETYDLTQWKEKEQKLMDLIDSELQLFNGMTLTAARLVAIEYSIKTILDSLTQCGIVTTHSLTKVGAAKVSGFSYKVVCTMFGFYTAFTITK